MLPWMSLAAAAAAAVEVGGPPAQTDRPKVRVSLIAETDSLRVGGTTDIGVRLEIEDAWHVYWHGRNDTGSPVSIAWTLPDGVEAGEIQWPAPTRHIAPGEILDHVYENDVLLIVPMRVDADVAAGADLVVRAQVKSVVCREMCISETSQASLSTRASAEGGVRASGMAKEVFEAARSRHAAPWPKDRPPADVRWRDGSVEIVSPGAVWMAFFPYEECIEFTNLIEDGETKEGTRGEHLTLRTEENQNNPSKRLFGVLGLRRVAQAAPSYYVVDMTGPAPQR